jgi:hypothetical protein
MASLTLFNSFTEALAEKTHNLGSDTLKWLLTNSAPVAANTVKADLTEITAANGYSAGGFTAAQSSSSQTGGVYTLATASAAVTASGGTVGPFRYAVLYNDTAAGDELIGYLDYGTNYTLPDGQPFTIPAQTVLTLQVG